MGIVADFQVESKMKTGWFWAAKHEYMSGMVKYWSDGLVGHGGSKKHLD
jgi:hypothetical protein